MVDWFLTFAGSKVGVGIAWIGTVLGVVVTIWAVIAQGKVNALKKEITAIKSTITENSGIVQTGKNNFNAKNMRGPFTIK